MVETHDQYTRRCREESLTSTIRLHGLSNLSIEKKEREKLLNCKNASEQLVILRKIESKAKAKDSKKKAVKERMETEGQRRCEGSTAHDPVDLDRPAMAFFAQHSSSQAATGGVTKIQVCRVCRCWRYVDVNGRHEGYGIWRNSAVPE